MEAEELHQAIREHNRREMEKAMEFREPEESVEDLRRIVRESAKIARSHPELALLEVLSVACVLLRRAGSSK